MKETITISRKN